MALARGVVVSFACWYTYRDTNCRYTSEVQVVYVWEAHQRHQIGCAKQEPFRCLEQYLVVVIWVLKENK